MRFDNYLTEIVMSKESLNKLLPDYSEILNIYKKAEGRYLYRGTKHKFGFASKVPRKRRRPLDTPLLFHNYLDEMFLKYFGWKARSNGLFTTISSSYSGYYGSNLYIVFPKNGFNYVYNQNIPDLYRHIMDAFFFYEKGTLPSDTKKDIEAIVKNYTDKGLLKLLKSYSDDIEVAIQCDKYYLLHKDYENLLDIFLRPT